MFILELKYEVTAILKIRRFDSLSVSWNYNTLVAALHIFKQNPLAVLWVGIA